MGALRWIFFDVGNTLMNIDYEVIARLSKTPMQSLLRRAPQAGWRSMRGRACRRRGRLGGGPGYAADAPAARMGRTTARLARRAYRLARAMAHTQRKRARDGGAASPRGYPAGGDLQFRWHGGGVTGNRGLGRRVRVRHRLPAPWRQQTGSKHLCRRPRARRDERRAGPVRWRPARDRHPWRAACGLSAVLYDPDDNYPLDALPQVDGRAARCHRITAMWQLPYLVELLGARSAQP